MVAADNDQPVSNDERDQTPTISQPAKDPAFLRIDNVGKVYPSRMGNITALKDISINIGSGQFISLLGPSGCGKSTLMRIVAGLEPLTTGSVALAGHRIDGPPDDMGIVFQRDVLLDWMTIEQNVLLPSRIKRQKTVEWKQKARDLLELLGLGGFESRYPWELSGGMRQRVAICRALLLNPSLLLMDEPFGALDAFTRDELNLELQRVWLSSAKTVLFVTHSISEAVFLSDRIIVMSRSPGRVIDDIEVDLGRPRDLAIRETPEFSRYVSRIRGIFESFGMLRGNHGTT